MPVRSEECETSTARPSWFIRRTARRPSAVSPPSTVSFSPEPERVGVGVGDADLPDARARRGRRACRGRCRSGWPPRGRTPARPARRRAPGGCRRRVRTTTTSDWCARSASRMPRSVTTSSHCHGALPVTQAVPSIMLSKTTVSPDARSPANAVCCRPVRLYRGVSAMSAREQHRVVVQADRDRSRRAAARPARTCSGAKPAAYGRHPAELGRERRRPAARGRPPGSRRTSSALTRPPRGDPRRPGGEQPSTAPATRACPRAAGRCA